MQHGTRSCSAYRCWAAASGGAIPPVCRLLNHSQVSFEAKVKDRKAEKKQHENRRMAMIKEVSQHCQDVCLSWLPTHILKLQTNALGNRSDDAASKREGHGGLRCSEVLVAVAHKQNQSPCDTHRTTSCMSADYVSHFCLSKAWSQVHFGAHTAEHDMQVKVKKAKEFLSKGHRVKCTLKHKPVRGQGQKDALKALPSLKERMAEFAEVSAPPATEKQTANTLSFYLAPIIEQNQMRATV